MTEQAETARKIAIMAGALRPCPSCGVVHRTGVDPAEGYKVANRGFSQGLYTDVFPDRRGMTNAVKDAIESALTTCACKKTPAHVKPPSPATTKPAAPTTAAGPTSRPGEEQRHPPGHTLRDIALAAVPSDLREALLTWAAENQITTPNDPFWPLATAMANSMRAATAAGQHAQALAEETARIPDLLYQNVTRAGADLKATLAQGIEAKTIEAGQALVQVIGVAASKGATDLQKAAAALDKIGAENGHAFVEQWKAELARAADRRERAGLFRAGGWLVVGALIVFCAGGVGMFATLAASDKIAPPQITTGWNPVAIYGPSAWEVCPGTDQTCVRPRLPMRAGRSKVNWFFNKYL